MNAIRVASTIGATILLSGLLAANPSGPGAVAQDTRSMTVLGSIDGTVGSTERSWVTISGEVNGKDMSSAAWRPYSLANIMENALEGMSEQQRAQMKKRMEMMEEMMGDDAGSNPMAQMFGGDGEEKIALRIMGVDPEAESILRQGGLTIELDPFSAEDINQILSGPNSAEISYHKNFGEQTGFYASSHDVGNAAFVEFDRLEIEEGGGAAEGTFEANLCPIQALMQGDIDPDVCIPVEGRFETELGEEAANNPGSGSGG